LRAVELDAVRDADIADYGSWPGALKGLHHGFFRTDAFEHRIRADAFGQLLVRNARLAALRYDAMSVAPFM
jgi:hypothetical protein